MDAMMVEERMPDETLGKAARQGAAARKALPVDRSPEDNGVVYLKIPVNQL
ncbi:hypothetical protein [Sphingobium herbicidovorans]|nr:hypothetical protein [Sphingobium herbicidovorans]